MTDIPLYLFAKAPVAGKAKQRLAPQLDPQQSAEVAFALLRHAANLVERGWPGERVLNVASNPRHEAFARYRNSARWSIRVQPDADLGERMREALQAGIERAGAAIVVGTDIPGLDEEILARAYACLEAGQEVVGPSQDGGFYLLGLRHIPPRLFEHIQWGGAGVYAGLMANARQLGRLIKPLPTLCDCDHFEDLRLAAMKTPGFSAALARAGFNLRLLSATADS